MPKQPNRCPAEGESPLGCDWEPAEEALTACAGIQPLVRTLRSFDVPGSVPRHSRVEQTGARLAEMVGHAMPSQEAARKFFCQFHEERRVEQAQRALAAGQVS